MSHTFNWFLNKTLYELNLKASWYPCNSTDAVSDIFLSNGQYT